MAEITAAMVKELREKTDAPMMECKKALIEAKGELDAAVDILRKKGVATAAKKASRDAKDGIIAQYVQPGAKVGVLAEVNCETDFVAKNETFRAFGEEIAKAFAVNPKADIEAQRAAQVAKIGENISIRRFVRYELGEGMAKKEENFADEVASMMK